MAMPFDLAIGQWYQVPRVGNSQLADVFPTNPGGSQAAITSAFSGACVDTSRKELLVWGGGHGDYTGNEVYAFNVNPASPNYLTWRRKTFPSTPLNNDSEANADGSPASRHTYSGILYSASLDKMVVAPGGFLAGPTGVASAASWLFDCTTESPNSAAPSAWTRKDDAPTIAPGGGPESKMSMVRDAVNGLYYTQHGRGFARFDPTAGTGSQWTELTNFEGPAVGFDTSIWLPGTPRHMVWSSDQDSGDIFARRLDTNAYIGAETTGVGATGAINILDFKGVGMGYEPNLGQAILWGGLVTGGVDRRDTYRLDFSTKVITRLSGTGDIPDAPATFGVYGRWAYLGDCGSQYNGLWMLVNSTTSDVYFYRSSLGPSRPAPEFGRVIYVMP